MAAAMRKTADGLEITYRALSILGGCFTIGAVLVSAVVSVAVARAQTTDALADRVTNARFQADSARLAEHMVLEATRNDDILRQLREVVQVTQATQTRTGQVWCELHFGGNPPASCK